MPAFFFMSRPKSAGRKVFPGTASAPHMGSNTASTGLQHQKQPSSTSEQESGMRRATPATVQQYLASTKPGTATLQRPLSAGGAVRYSSTGFMGGQAEVKGTNVTSSMPVTNPELFVRYKRPKSAAPSRSSAPSSAPSPSSHLRPRSAHHKTPHASSAATSTPPIQPPFPYPINHYIPAHPPPTAFALRYGGGRPEPPPPPHAHMGPTRRMTFTTTTAAPASGPSVPRYHPQANNLGGKPEHHHVSPPPEGGPHTMAEGRRDSSSSSRQSMMAMTAQMQHMHLQQQQQQQQQQQRASGLFNHYAPQHRPQHQMAWEGATTGSSNMTGARAGGQPTLSSSTSSSSPPRPHARPSRSRPSEDGSASHVRNYDVMIPLNREAPTPHGSQRTGSYASNNGEMASENGSNGFPSQTTAELESRHILRQLRNRVGLMGGPECGPGEHGAIAPPPPLCHSSETCCTPRTRLYLQQIMLCKVLSWRSTTDFYTFGQLLGQGSFAKVRVAVHKLTGQQVAIKTYEKAKLKDSKHWRRVQQEVRLMERLNNSRVIRLFETIESPKRIHIVMEYLSGSNLCNYVKSKRRLEEDEARVIFSQILESMQYIHALNIVHRDIKLENVLFDEFQRAKLVDFGFSVICKDKKLHVFCGTPSYMAPEIVKRKDYLGKPVDLWSAGVVLYALLCGRFPFSAKTYPELYKKIARGVYSLPDELSLSAKDLIRNLLVVDPERRYTLAQAQAHPWLAGVPKTSTLEHATPKFLIAANPQDDVDRDVVCAMERFGVPRDLLISCILHRQRNSITTTYYLLRHAMSRQPQHATSTAGKTRVGEAMTEAESKGRPSTPMRNYTLQINNKMATGNDAARRLAMGTR